MLFGYLASIAGWRMFLTAQLILRATFAALLFFDPPMNTPMTRSPSNAVIEPASCARMILDTAYR